MIRPLEYLTVEPPASAIGQVWHRVDGVVTDHVEFAFVAPDSWRVLHASGEEIISVGADYWRRDSRSEAWRHDRDPHGVGVHHTGYLRGMLFPELLPGLSHRRSRVAEQETAADGSRRLLVRHEEPVPGTMMVVVTAVGRLRRIAGTEADRTIEIELDADFGRAIDPALFDPTSPQIHDVGS
jgi:hypothetical protein